MQEPIENDGGEHEKPVDTMYIGNKDITMAIENLKAEIHQARLDTAQTIKDRKGIEETIEANHIRRNIWFHG